MIILMKLDKFFFICKNKCIIIVKENRVLIKKKYRGIYYIL